jgi:hypothetical protein
MLWPWAKMLLIYFTVDGVTGSEASTGSSLLSVAW